CFEGPDHRSHWRPDTQSSPAHGSRCVGRSNETRKDNKDRAKMLNGKQAFAKIRQRYSENHLWESPASAQGSEPPRLPPDIAMTAALNAAEQHICMNLCSNYSGLLHRF